MSTKKFFPRLAAALTAAAVSAAMCASAVYADEYENLFSDDAQIEEVAENLSEQEDLEAVAGASNDEKIVTIPARTIKLTSRRDNTISLGSSFSISYTLKPFKSDDYVTYRSLDRTVAQVTEDGVVTGVGAGSTIIRLKTTSGAKANVYVDVTEGGFTEEKVSSISVIDENIMLRKGKTSAVQYLLYPLGSKDTVTYSSSNTAVAAVSSGGIITGLESGSAVITLKTSSGITAECYVTVYSGVYKGIDVSKWQGDINWSRVCNNGVDFAMIRSSFGSSNVDIKLKQNVAGCEKYGIPYGFYHYTYASSALEARKEARYFLKNIKNYNPEYPVVLDIEEDMYKKMSRKKVTDIICAFMEELEGAGYYAMIYSYADFFNDCTDMSRLEPYDIWVACWGDTEKLNDSYDHHYGMWQYSSKGTVSGIDGDVDLNYAYKDYASRIRKAGLNNLPY